MNRRNVELVYPHNARQHYPIADDKLLAKEHFTKAGVPVAETLAVCDGLFDVARVVTELEALENFVVKPASGAGGDGILVVGARVGDGRWRRAGGAELEARELHKHLADTVFGAYSKQMEDRAFVERRIEPHPLFRTLWADGLCDLRVITLESVPILAMVRVPTARSGGRANLHQGGLGLAIDLQSGRTVRAFSQGQYIETHPETQAPLLDLEMPGWSDILEIARITARSVPLGYLGVDLVVDRERGPLVLEINARPGLEIQNVHGRGLGVAIAEAMR
jgi:alpha-L-glutamate ligase-like protein